MALSDNSDSLKSSPSENVPNIPDSFPPVGKQSYKFSLKSFGVSFDLSANRSDLVKQAMDYLPLGTRSSLTSRSALRYSLIDYGQSKPGVASGYRLRRNGRQLFASADQQEFLERFHSVVSLDVAERSRQRTFIHCGVVGWGGFAILIPGRSFTGKTTLVAELIRAGATYYSDEFAVVDKRGRVHPYPRALQVREQGGHHQTERPVEHFGAVAGRKPLAAKLILVTRFKPDGHWRPRPLSPGIGLLQLLDNTVSARRSPAMAMENLKQVVLGAMIVRGVRGDASQLTDWIGAHFGAPGSAEGKSR